MPVKEQKYVWMDGEFVKWKDAKVPILTHCLHYGTGVFEGIRAYPSENNLNIFRLREHLQRLKDSAKVYYLETKYSIEDLSKAIIELLRRNNIRESAYIRPIIYVGYGPIGLNYSGLPVNAAVCTMPYDKYFQSQTLRVRTSSWRKFSDETTPPLAKACGNYLNSALAKLEAVRDGYDEALLLNHKGLVSEGTGENIFVVKDGVISTPSISSSILKGVTRDAVIRLSSDLGFNVQEREITRGELYLCDEVFFTGTAAEVTPIVELDRRIIGDGKPGRVTREVEAAFEEVVQGKNEKYLHWLTPVY